MIGFNIPRSYYATKLAPSDPTDYLEFEVVPSGGSGPAHATLRIYPQSNGKPHGKGPKRAGVASLTDIEVTLYAPRFTVGDASISPPPVDMTTTKPGVPTCCGWRHRECRQGVRMTYEVPLWTTLQTGTVRCEFRVRAAELKRPVVLAYDVRLAGTTQPTTKQVKASTITTAKPKAKSAAGGAT